jgi:hypothetical protein
MFLLNCKTHKPTELIRLIYKEIDMTLTVTIRDNEGNTINREFDCYESKKELREDMNRNGYTVIGRVFTKGDDETRLGNLYWNYGVR